MKRFLLSAVLFSCSSAVVFNLATANEVDLEPTPFSNYLQDSFDDYVKETKAWIRDHLLFRSEDKEAEIKLNAPFELKPNTPNGTSVLLVHGLSDSPYSFIDVATKLSENGFLVRTVLLPGHGAKPADLLLPTIDDWLAIVRHHTQLLQRDSSEVWLGGFSTGANLALIEAIDNPNVAGTLLFSPAIVSAKPLDFLAPFAKHFMTWADVDPETSITRFDSLTMNGAALYYETTTLVRDRLAAKPYKKPTLFTLSESDSVVDSEALYDYFETRFPNEENRLVWFGDSQWQDKRASSYTMKLPEMRISTGSHMAALFAPNNPLYGENGTQRICNNGQSDKDEAACEAGAEVWYSYFDYTEPNKIHARLTWLLNNIGSKCNT